MNLAIHLAATLALFGILRRTLAVAGREVPDARFAAPTATAFAAALLWTVHPLQTESVTCIIQRTETLMGLCYLLTLYSFIRYCGEAAGSRAWAVLAILCCLLGMACKEVMVTAPVIVLLYDRAFVSGSLREAWRRHGRLHLALAATWIFLAFLVVRAGGSRGSAAGFVHGASSWGYLLTQCRAIALYLRLSFWPHPLVLDYGTGLVTGLEQVWPQALLIPALLACVGWALVAHPALGFIGVWFFLILAPSSSVVPLAAQTIAEHRMYLPLAAIAALVAMAATRWLGRLALPVCVALAAVLIVGTLQRNETYRSEVGIWSDTVAKASDNPRAHNNLGIALQDLPGRLNEAIAQYEKALRLNPYYAEAHLNLGNALRKIPGRSSEVIAQYKEALRLEPDLVQAHFNLGSILDEDPGRSDEAVAQYKAALLLRPDYAEADYNLGCALSKKPGRLGEAIAYYEEALRLKPDLAEAHYNLGCALDGMPGRMNEAIAHYQEAVRLRPEYVEARSNLGTALVSQGRATEAIAQYEEALRLRPEDAAIHLNLAYVLIRTPGRSKDGVAHLKEVIRLQPGNEAAFKLLIQLSVSQQ
jgi:tetratricopeptide (TPR) repeat protein